MQNKTTYYHSLYLVLKNRKLVSILHKLKTNQKIFYIFETVSGVEGRGILTLRPQGPVSRRSRKVSAIGKTEESLKSYDY